MGFFSGTLKTIGDLFEEAGAGVGDVVEDIGTAVFGEPGTRGRTIGERAGSFVEARFGIPGATEVGGRIGQSISGDIERAPDVYQEQQRQAAQQKAAQQDQIESVSDAPITEQDYRNLQRGRQIYTAGFPSTADEGTVIDIRLPKPKTAPGVVIGAGMDFLEEVGEFFFGDDNGAPMTGMQMCRPARAKAFSVNPNTGCISITRKQQAKLKELVRMVGIEQASKQIGLPVSMTSQLLLKTFRSQRKGISGADIRAVKRVDRQMHSLACALGGISQTSRAVASRKSPPKRNC
tara:strand:+ start:238 stop:1110 length:873 start_codon:yes stop_codon:yes gene_type:complete